MEGGLYRAGNDAPAVGDTASRGQTLLEGRHAAVRLQGIAGRDKEPDLIEMEASAGDVDDVPVAGVRRIEGAAEQADTGAPAIAEARQPFVPDGLVQGRT